MKFGNPGGIAQLGERLPCKQEAMSSNLIISNEGIALKFEITTFEFQFLTNDDA